MNDNKDIIEQYPHKNKKGNRYRTYIDHDTTHEMRQFEDGTLYNVTLGRLQGGKITSENSVSMQQKGIIARKEKAREKIRQYVTQEIAAISPEDIATFEDAYGSISGRLASEAYLGDATLQSRTKAFEVIGRAVGLYDKDLQLEMDTPAGKVTGDASQFLEILNKMSGGRE